MLVTPEQKANALKEQRKHVELRYASERTYLIALAVHQKDPQKNIVTKVSCKKGVPLDGYIYDTKSDSYYFECNDFLHLGYIPISLILQIRGHDWNIRVPLAESVIQQYLEANQVRDLVQFKSQFAPPEYRIQYVQMIEPN